MPNQPINLSIPPDKNIHPDKAKLPSCPTRIRFPSSQTSLLNSTFNEVRNTAVEYAGPAILLGLDQFLNHALPQSLTKEQIQLVIDEMNVYEQVKKMISTGRRNKSVNEERFFEHIGKIIQKVGSVGSEVLKMEPVGGVRYQPRGHPESSERNNSTRPDCKILLNKPRSSSGKRTTAEALFCEAVATFEFKKIRDSENIYSVSPMGLHLVVVAGILIGCTRIVYSYTGTCGIFFEMIPVDDSSLELR